MLFTGGTFIEHIYRLNPRQTGMGAPSATDTTCQSRGLGLILILAVETMSLPGCAPRTKVMSTRYGRKLVELA